MPKTFTSNVFNSSYKDDFKDSDNYHRILFNSGRALQARELTQMQTIIQEEISRFGRNIFKDGAAVNPGGPATDTAYEFIKLNTSTNTLPSDLTTLVGTEFTGQTSSVKARVLEVFDVVGTDPATLYVQYTNTAGASAGEITIRMSAGEDLSNGADTLTVQSTNTVSNPAIGVGCQFSATEGDFFVRGRFVFSAKQSILLSKYSRYPTKVVGFKVTEDIITVADTDELYDNQGATPNLSSPGADRYRIKLTLTTEDLVATDENFVYYAHVVDGEVVDQVTGFDDYKAPDELVAIRTKEESGDYIAKTFTVDFTDSGTNLIASVSDGTAYVNGYRANAVAPDPLVIPKPRNTATLTNEVAGITYGQYFLCNVLKGNLDIRTFAKQNLRSAAAYGGSTIGTARVRAVEEDGANYRVYLFDIQMNSGQSLRNVKSFGTSSTKVAQPILVLNKAVIKQSLATNLVYALPNPRPKNITDVDFEVQRIITGTSNGSGSLTVSLSATGETFSNTSQWIFTRNDTGVVVAASANGAGTNSSTITSLPNSQAVTIYAKVNKAQPSVRQKTLDETTFSGAVESDGTGTKFVNLHSTDVYSVLSIKQTDSAGSDLSHLFTVDNGQRAGFYDNARLVLDGGATAPSGSVFTRYKHFTHGAGDYFSVNSYTGQVEYENIPSFSVGPRSSVNLRDVIDFRSSVDSAGLFVAGDAAHNEIPTNGDIFQGDVEYYVPRSDKIVITTAGEIKNIQGEAGFSSQIPATPENTLGLFEVEHNAYGLNDSDIAMNPLEAKRFTMKDISQLEKRIDNLEEVTSLSLLEVATSSLLVLDSDGNTRMKSGFFVDNFVDRSFTDAGNAENRSAIDPSRGLLAPQTVEDNVALIYDSALSSNTIMKGDTVYLNYTHKEAIAQPLVSGTENVNPFAVITGEGSLTLSPASDEWMSTTYKPANIINKTATEDLGILNEGELAAGTAVGRGFTPWVWSGRPWISLGGFGFGRLPLFGGWRGMGAWNWNGVNLNTARTSNGISSTRNTQQQGNSRVTTNTFSQSVVVGNRTVRKVVGDKTVSLTFIPFMRSRKIFFKAEGLRPSTRYFPFFDGKTVADFCREETFDRYARKNAGTFYGQQFKNSVAHPQGSTNLEADANGVIEGSFFIPNSPTNRFRAGTREFKLLDISKNDEANALSHANINYVAQGTLDTRQRSVTSTRITQTRTRRWTETTRVRNRDPLAQSFTVTNPSGMFVTKVQTYFKTKDDSISIEMQIRPMVNGIPSAEDIIGNAIKVLPPSQVSVAGSQTQTGVAAAPTTFEFDEPVFLNPNTDYAIVLLAESTDYEAYVAETYAFELGSTEKRISRQPSMGSLFKSQNGKTWQPDQTKDLTFRLFQAQFDTAGGYAVFENRDLEKELAEENPFFTDSGDATVTMLFPNHGYDVNDTIIIEGLTDATRYNGILGSSINGSNTVTAVDGFGLRFEADSASTSGGRFGGSDIVSDKQIQFDAVTPNFTTLLPDDTTLTYGVKYTTGKSLAAVSGQQTRYQKDAVYSSEVSVGQENFFSTPRLIAKSINETAELGSGVKSTSFKVDMGTIRADVSPLIDAQRTSLTTITNLIDNQSSTVVNGFNVPLSFAAETVSFGGSALAKHITSPATLAEDAVGMKVLVAALRPSGADFDLYYRVATDGVVIFNEDWTLQTPEQTIAVDDNNFREYRYLIGGDGGSVDPFTQYQFKIVMRSNNSSKIPVFKDFRAIALAV
jgi:hypothetical protein